jgi:hypothetical protein
MTDSDEDHDKSRKSGAEDKGRSSTCRVLSGWTIQRSGDTLCDLHRANGYWAHCHFS